MKKSKYMHYARDNHALNTTDGSRIKPPAPNRFPEAMEDRGQAGAGLVGPGEGKY